MHSKERPVNFEGTLSKELPISIIFTSCNFSSHGSHSCLFKKNTIEVLLRYTIPSFNY